MKKSSLMIASALALVTAGGFAIAQTASDVLPATPLMETAATPGDDTREAGKDCDGKPGKKRHGGHDRYDDDHDYDDYEDDDEDEHDDDDNESESES